MSTSETPKLENKRSLLKKLYFKLQIAFKRATDRQFNKDFKRNRVIPNFISKLKESAFAKCGSLETVKFEKGTEIKKKFQVQHLRGVQN